MGAAYINLVAAKHGEGEFQGGPMDSHLLEMFDAVYDTGSISKAAAKLYLTRQTLSAGVQTLENSVGVTLFRRTATGSDPTRAADMLRDFTSRQSELWLSCLERMRSEVDQRTITIGGSMLFMHPDLLKSLLQAQIHDPSMSVSFSNFDEMPRLVTALEDGSVDIAGIWQIPDNEELEPIMLFSSPVMLLMDHRNPLAQLERVDAEIDVTGVTFLFVSSDTCSLVERQLAAHGAFASVIEPNAALIQSILETENAVFPIPYHHASGVQTDGIVDRPVVNYPYCGVSAIMATKRRSEFLDEYIEWNRENLWSKVASSWEEYLKTYDSSINDTYIFQAPVSESPAWDIPCPFAQPGMTCCEHCRQAHSTLSRAPVVPATRPSSRRAR